MGMDVRAPAGLRAHVHPHSRPEPLGLRYSTDLLWEASSVGRPDHLPQGKSQVSRKNLAPSDASR